MKRHKNTGQGLPCLVAAVHVHLLRQPQVLMYTIQHISLGPVYTKRQSQRYADTCDIVLIEQWKQIESLQIGVATHFGTTLGVNGPLAGNRGCLLLKVEMNEGNCQIIDRSSCYL